MPLTRTALPALLLAAALTACSSGSPSSAPTPSPSSPTPSPTPTLPTAAADKVLAKAALITAAELGKPWIEPKSVNRVKTKAGNLCPGKPGSEKLEKPRAVVTKQMTEGSKTGAAIGSFGVRTFAYGQEAAWRAAVAKAENACLSWKAVEGNYVTLQRIASPPAVAGADEVLAHVERIWADAAHKTLQYVRHWIEARVGRIVCVLEYAFLVPKTDPTGKDLTKTVGLLEKQVAKAAAKFTPTS
jgi:hypothetical protein